MALLSHINVQINTAINNFLHKASYHYIYQNATSNNNQKLLISLIQMKQQIFNYLMMIS